MRNRFVNGHERSRAAVPYVTRKKKAPNSRNALTHPQCHNAYSLNREGVAGQTRSNCRTSVGQDENIASRVVGRGDMSTTAPSCT
eukprot:1830879-Amphidinium_carterae.1